MGEFFTGDWQGAPFELFGTAHMIALIVVAFSIMTVIILARRAAEKGRQAIKWGLAATLLINEVAFHVWNMAVGTWNIQTMLPFHICSALVWVSVVMMFKYKHTFYEISYLLGIAGALQALLTPDVIHYGFPHFRFFQVFISHGTLIIVPLYFTFVENKRPTLESVKRVIIIMNIYAAIVFIINMVIGSNYLFIGHVPETPSLIDMLPPWPWYIVVIELLAIGFIFLFYAPFAIKDWRAKKATVCSYAQPQ